MTGLCECGCGQPTSLARYTDRTKGWVKGQPLRFRRYHRLPPVRRGADNHRFNGGLCLSKSGRWLIVHRDGCTSLYYRAVMEAHLGRELRSDEIVHHKNGDSTDDRIKNLELTTRAAHARLHAELRRAA